MHCSFNSQNRRAYWKELPVEALSLLEFAATNGYFDNIAADDADLFEQELIRSADEALLSTIKQEVELSKITSEKLHEHCAEFLETFIEASLLGFVSHKKELDRIHALPCCWTGGPYLIRSNGKRYSGERELLPFIDPYQNVLDKKKSKKKSKKKTHLKRSLPTVELLAKQPGSRT
jgi:hypothetical protein